MEQTEQRAIPIHVHTWRRHCRIVTLDAQDMALVAQHTNWAQQDGARNPQRKQYAGSQETRYHLGALSECAFAKLYSLDWSPRNTPDSGYDFLVNNHMRVDVKGCPHQDGSLVLTADMLQRQRCDYFVLVSRFSAYTSGQESWLIRGCVSWEDATHRAHMGDLGRGNTFFIPAWELLPMHIFEHAAGLTVTCNACKNPS